jgi:hypothetical protein
MASNSMVIFVCRSDIFSCPHDIFQDLINKPTLRPIPPKCQVRRSFDSKCKQNVKCVEALIVSVNKMSSA